MQALEIDNIVRSFDGFRAVDGISFSVPEESFTAFLGPNGAGKSTTISMVCSLLAPDSGTIRVLGRDSRDPESRRRIGVVFQNPMLDGRLTVRENLAVRGAMYGLDDVDRATEDALNAADCAEFADRRYGTLSGGQRRRADIARALVHSPGILILDEPTSGLDPHTRQVIWNSVRRLNREKGITVLLTTHYMEEASGADDIVIVNRGRIVARGTPEELKERYSRDRMTLVPTDLGAAEDALGSAGVEYSVDRGVVTVPLRSTMDALPVIDILRGCIESFEVRTGTLDEAFVSITEESE